VQECRCDQAFPKQERGLAASHRGLGDGGARCSLLASERPSNRAEILQAKLRTLDVGNNEIEVIEGIAHLSELEEFWVRTSKLSLDLYSIPAEPAPDMSSLRDRTLPLSLDSPSLPLSLSPSLPLSLSPFHPLDPRGAASADSTPVPGQREQDRLTPRTRHPARPPPEPRDSLSRGQPMSDERHGRVQEEGHVGPTPGQAD
jgi:hypothetical protein